MMIDLCLRADDEATLAAALPMLRYADAVGVEHWVTAWPGGALLVIGPMVVTQAVVADGEIVRPAEVDPRRHVNLRVDDAADGAAALLAAAEPYVVRPAAPGVVWTGAAR